MSEHLKTFDRIGLDRHTKYKNWRDMKILVFDLETTGVNPFDRNDTKIVQVCAKLMQRPPTDPKPVAIKVINQLINPEMPIPEGATNVHKITDEHVSDAQTFSEAAESIIEILGHTDVLCAYNGIGFDLPLLCRELYDAGFTNIGHTLSNDIPILDPLVFQRRKKGKFSGVRLIDTAIEYNCQGVGQVAHGEFDLHNAEVDVDMLANVLWEMKHILPWSLDEAVEIQYDLWREQEEHLNQTYEDRYATSMAKHLNIPIKDWESQEEA